MSAPRKLSGGGRSPPTCFQFGNQKIVTRVHMMFPAETDSVSLAVLDYMWEERMPLLRSPSKEPLWKTNSLCSPVMSAT